jgi:hypothetical protein
VSVEPAETYVQLSMDTELVIAPKERLRTVSQLPLSQSPIHMNARYLPLEYLSGISISPSECLVNPETFKSLERLGNVILLTSNELSSFVYVVKSHNQVSKGHITFGSIPKHSVRYFQRLK